MGIFHPVAAVLILLQISFWEGNVLSSEIEEPQKTRGSMGQPVFQYKSKAQPNGQSHRINVCSE